MFVRAVPSLKKGDTRPNIGVVKEGKQSGRQATMESTTPDRSGVCLCAFSAVAARGVPDGVAAGA